MYVDSHCHLNMLQGDLEQALELAKQHGVQFFLNVAVTLDDHPQLVQSTENHNNIVISAGPHPNEKPQTPLDLAYLKTAILHPKVVAIGETGLDYYRIEGDKQWQQERFEQHIACGKEFKKPLIIHTRQAQEDTIAIMRAQQADQVGGVMHCFTEDWSMAKAALDLNFYISFSGIVTFKNATQIQDVARQVPLDRILIETDSPYLAPVPHRGKTNTPAYVSHVAEYLATLRAEPLESIARQTTENFFRLFPLAKPSISQ